MHNRARIVAGTALALVMTAAYAGSTAHAGPLAEPVRAQLALQSAAPAIRLAQAAPEEEAERPPEEEAEEEGAVEPAPDEPAPPAPEEAPAEEPAPPAEPPVEGGAEPVPEAPQPPVAEEPPAQEPAAPAEEPAPPAEEPAEPPVEGGAEPVPDEPQPPVAEQPPAEQPAPPAEPPVEDAPEPVREAPLPEEPTAEEPAAEEPAAEEPAAEDPAAEEPATEQPATEEEPVREEPLAEEPESEEPLADEPAAEQPEAEEPAAEEDAGDEPLAPILDSEKEGAPGEEQPTGEQPAETEQQPADGDGQPAETDEDVEQQPAEALPMPTSDEEAQQLEEPVEIEALRAEEGRRIDRRDRRRERREDADVLREIGSRLIIELGGQVIVRNEDRDRIEHDASEVYYEELRRGRTRETVVRPNGVQVVTVYDRYGDVIRRSRIMPDGREVLLVYADRRDRDRDGPRRWHDPAADLPPLHLTIPVEEYILDAGRVRDEDVYYEFLDQPPVEPVRRLYSVDEVRYSARIRDSVRRVDLDTITFGFGSAEISEDAIPRLEGVAEAMQRLLEENPGETFLIEGHTDAVGSDQANLALSDQRAEAVAIALTSVFDIPPENLVTQGYGESYLKVATEEPEQENRRVAIRRITPLVAPVANAQ